MGKTNLDKYTVVGIHDSGLGWIVHIEAQNADDALKIFKERNQGTALVVFKGHHENQVRTNTIVNECRSIPGATTIRYE